MKRIITLVLALALLIPMAAVAKKKEKAQISFTEQTHNFGTIPEKGGPVSCDFEFTNTGGANLIILSANAECGCTTPEFPKNPIAPGKKGKIRVTYNPLGRPGSFTKMVTVRTNGKQKKAHIKITGIVNPNAKK